MSDSTENKAKGTWNEVKGKTKQTVGGMTDDKSMQAEGKADEMKGKVQKNVGDLQGKLDDLTDDKRG